MADMQSKSESISEQLSVISSYLSFISGYIEIVPQSQVRVKSFQNFFSINLCNENKGLAASESAETT